MLQFWRWALDEVFWPSSMFPVFCISRDLLFGVSCHFVWLTLFSNRVEGFVQQGIFSDGVCARDTLCLFSTALALASFSHGMCAAARRILASVSVVSLMWMAFLMCETNYAAVVCSVKREVILLRALHVRNVDRVVVRIGVFASLVLFVWAFVHGVDKREVNCVLSSCVTFEAAWYQPSFFEGFFRAPRAQFGVLSHRLVRGSAARKKFG